LPDFLLRGIDHVLAERIKAIARERNWALNDVFLHLIRQGLGDAVEEPSVTTQTHRDIAHLSGTWAPDEAAAFRAAMEAFEDIPTDDSLPSSRK
jgi:hypothetical protein